MHQIRVIAQSEYLLIGLDELMELFGVLLLVLIGIELLNTIKIYLRCNKVHVELVVLVAIIAIARKVIVLKVEELSADVIIAISVLIASLAASYFLIRKAGLLSFDCNDNDKELKNKAETPLDEKEDELVN